MRIIDCTQAMLDDAGAEGPRPGLVGVACDESTGVTVFGRIDGDRVVPQTLQLAGTPADLRTLAPFADPLISGHREQYLELDARTRLRGDRVHSALAQLRAPLSLLRADDAVLILAPGEDGLPGRYDARVSGRGPDGTIGVAQDWYSLAGLALDGSPRRILSTTTMSGQHAYGDLNNEINAQLFLLQDRIEQWNPDSPQMQHRIAAWTHRLQAAVEDIEGIEEHIDGPDLGGPGGPSSLLNAASDLNLTSARLNSWLRKAGVRLGPAPVSTVATVSTHPGAAPDDPSAGGSTQLGM